MTTGHALLDARLRASRHDALVGRWPDFSGLSDEAARELSEDERLLDKFLSNLNSDWTDGWPLDEQVEVAREFLRDRR